MKKTILSIALGLTLSFIIAQSTPCDSLTVTGSQYQLQITANNLNTFIFYWETSSSDGTILEQDSSMSNTHNVYNNSSSGQPDDTLITCISTGSTNCCAILIWDGTNWINSSGTNPPPPSNCNANYYVYNSNNTPNSNPNLIYLVENASGGTSPYTYLWDFGDGSNSSLQYPSHTFTQSGNFNVCYTITDANGCSDTYCDTITIPRVSVATLIVISPQQVNTVEIDALDPSIIYPNPVNENPSLIIYSKSNQTVDIAVFDIYGKEISAYSLYINQGANTINLVTSYFNKGSYFISIDSKKDQRHEIISFIK